MTPKNLRFATVLTTLLMSASAFAWIPEGFWTDGWNYYYVNSRQEYCSSYYKPEARRLTYYQQQELSHYRYQGQCEAYDKGPKNFQGRSYYFNGEGAYCQYRYYKYNLVELNSYQADYLFRSNRFDGFCVE